MTILTILNWKLLFNKSHCSFSAVCIKCPVDISLALDAGGRAVSKTQTSSPWGFQSCTRSLSGLEQGSDRVKNPCLGPGRIPCPSTQIPLPSVTSVGSPLGRITFPPKKLRLICPTGNSYNGNCKMRVGKASPSLVSGSSTWWVSWDGHKGSSLQWKKIQLPAGWWARAGDGVSGRAAFLRAHAVSPVLSTVWVFLQEAFVLSSFFSPLSPLPRKPRLQPSPEVCGPSLGYDTPCIIC